MEAEQGILLKAEIVSTYKGILNPLLKTIVTNSGLIIFFSLSESLTDTYIYQHSFTEFSGVSLEIWPNFSKARKQF